MIGGPVRKLVCCALLLLVTIASESSAREEITLVGDQIGQSYYIGSRFIFDGSDSLYLGGRLLERDRDYSFNSRRSSFDLSRLNAGSGDTLRIIFNRLPSWIALSYGRSLEEITPTTVERIDPILVGPQVRTRAQSSEVDISGAKTFRFTTRSAGSSSFNQSLDLQISGHLTPGLEITGAVSDRGVDPSYGTVNSRLNELDKINLKLSSKNFTGQIGDILIDRRATGVAASGRRISGAAFDLRQERWHLNGAAARPRGRFETVRFNGIDGMQGPYQIGDEARSLPVVPGSESVWLDGLQLERGANKDYTMDYPAGRITFNVNHPIDNRSRVEIDYEPQATEFKGELFTTGGGLVVGDSAITVDLSWARDGDDKEQPLAGELSQTDLDLLQNAGDQTQTAVRSGVMADTLGSYLLVVDSLPDSVYQYVGQPNGDYTIRFTRFGTDQGDYIFLGGDNFRYVGPSEGDYLPVVLIEAPERTDRYTAALTLRDSDLGELDLQFQQTTYDRNLLSDIDDSDNDGIYYSIRASRRWLMHDHESYISAGTRNREAEFRFLERINRPDFDRDYLLPQNYAATTDEAIHELNGSFTPTDWLTISPFYSMLDYKGSFDSKTGGFDAELRSSDRLRLNAGLKRIDATLDSLGGSRDGKGVVWDSRMSWRFYRGVSLTGEYEYDRRENDYADISRGTRYSRIRTGVGGRSEQVRYEYYVEDSLVTDWSQRLERNRLSVSSTRERGPFSYDALATYQWLNDVDFDETSFLSRANLQYSNLPRKLNFGVTYAISDETRNSRGISYIEVEPGEGSYIKEDGEFVPDPDGDFIRVEEILSDQARVRRGEKSFHLNKSWSKAVLRLHSNIQEELIEEGERQFWWVVPFLSDRDQPYLFYSRRYDADLRLFPLPGGHIVNLSLNDNRESRQVAGENRERHDLKGSVILRQVVGEVFLSQQVEYFSHDRDDYYSGGGDIDGGKIVLGMSGRFPSGELSLETSFRRAESALDERSDQYAVIAGSRVQIIKKGEFRSSLEFYSQTFKNTGTNISYLLTDNRSGEKGAIWSASVRYGVRGGMRVNFSLSGRHSDDRTARITGRGELVAGF